jgi:peptide chain release factor 2
MHDIKVQIAELERRLHEIKKSFDLEEKQKVLNRLESESMDPNLWDDQEKARKLMQELSDVKKQLDEIREMEDDITTLAELAKENELSGDLANDIKVINKKIEEFELTSFLSGKYDNRDAIVSIHAGQGGTEAMDWANMLFRMFTRFAERRGWSFEVVNLSSGEEAGIKSVTFKVDGPYAYGFLKGEVGTHRLVRQSPFNADNLRQTSFALVEVLPELEETDMPDIQIKDEDLEWQFFRSGGHGGQNVNKVSTAVRVKHLPSGITVSAQTERHQEKNRAFALNLLRAKLWALEQEKEEKQIKDIKGEYRPASWGNQIRSYVLHPYKMVKDLRTQVESSDPDAVLDGEIDEFIDAELKGLR